MLGKVHPQHSKLATVEKPDSTKANDCGLVRETGVLQRLGFTNKNPAVG